LKSFKDDVSAEKFNVDLSTADFSKEPYSDLIGCSHTISGSVSEYFWKANNVNTFADNKDVDGATQAINGGKIGFSERKEFHDRANMGLGVE
jgi:predicted chitinase